MSVAEIWEISIVDDEAGGVFPIVCTFTRVALIAVFVSSVKTPVAYPCMPFMSAEEDDALPFTNTCVLESKCTCLPPMVKVFPLRFEMMPQNVTCLFKKLLLELLSADASNAPPVVIVTTKNTPLKTINDLKYFFIDKT